MAGRGSRSRARPISSRTARAEAKGWRLTLRTEDGQRLCYRMEIERFALNFDGLQSVQRTACDGAGWTNYVPLTPKPAAALPQTFRLLPRPSVARFSATVSVGFGERVCAVPITGSAPHGPGVLSTRAGNPCGAAGR
jgi:hypothetical protein